MKTVIAFLLLLHSHSCFSQDLRGGYFRQFWLADSTYMLQATLFCDTVNEAVRPYCYFNFGTAYGENVPIVTSTQINGVILKTYARSEIYSLPIAKPILLTVLASTLYWKGGIRNFKTSDSAYLEMRAKIHFKDDIARNRYAPSIGNIPLRLRSNGNQITYNPNCTDADQDSLTFRLVNFSSYIPPQANIDPVTGTFTFTNDTPGLYAFNIEITEWRKDSLGVDTINGVSELAFLVEMNSNTSINEFQTAFAEWNVYPNPARETLHLKVPDHEKKNVHIIVLNTCGEEVYQGTFTESIRIADLPSGIYSIQLISQSDIKATHRFVKY